MVYSKSMNAQYTLLGFLAQGSNYGYELKKKYDDYFGKDKPILAGQVYSILARLKRDGKVKEIVDTGTSGGPDRVRYAITKKDIMSYKNGWRLPKHHRPSYRQRCTLSRYSPFSRREMLHHT